MAKMAGGLLLAVLIASCSSARPADTADICGVFEERRAWYRAAVKSQERWGVPLHVSMAFIQQESGFASRAKPPRSRILGFIPGPRPSSAFGFAQAVNGTWEDYKRATGNGWARRASFDDAVDFIGWYNHTSHRNMGIDPGDAYHLYLAYHEGHGGYASGSWNGKPWLLDISRRVQANAERYQAQYARCERELGRNWFLRLLF